MEYPAARGELANTLEVGVGVGAGAAATAGATIPHDAGRGERIR